MATCAIMGGDLAHTRTDGEDDFDHLIERDLEGFAAQRAFIRFSVNVFQRCRDVEHATAGRTEYVPRQIENAELGCMQEGRDSVLLVEAASGREGKHVDADKLAVGA